METTFGKWALITAFFITGGCATEPEFVEQDFGNSVRQMVDAQIYDVDAAMQPGDAPPEMIDGVAVEHVIDGYRENAKRKKEDRPPLLLQLGE